MATGQHKSDFIRIEVGMMGESVQQEIYSV